MRSAARVGVLTAVVMGLTAGVTLAEEPKKSPDVPIALQGDWAVNTEPTFDNQFRLPPPCIRIKGKTFVYRFREMKEFLGGTDADTGQDMILVKDDDGVRYWEWGWSAISVRTDTKPWQIDLLAQDKDGKAVEKNGKPIVKKGICTLKDDTITLSIGNPGKERPSSFDDPGFMGDFRALTAKRVKKEK